MITDHILAIIHAPKRLTIKMTVSTNFYEILTNDIFSMLLLCIHYIYYLHNHLQLHSTQNKSWYIFYMYHNSIY